MGEIIKRFVTVLSALCAACVSFVLLGGLAGGEDVAAQEASRSKPNVIFVLTDDQDAPSVGRMSEVREMASAGTTFENATYPDPLCCPSRASLLTGLYPHNHGVWDNFAPRGGEPAFRQNGNESRTVARSLKLSGYRTALFGKYLNQYDPPRVPSGWDRWFAGISNVWSECYSDNGKKRCFRDQHPDKVIADKTLDFIRNRRESKQPYFAWVSFTAPHSNARYEKKYADRFGDARVPRQPNYDEKDVSDKPEYISEQRPVPDFRKRKMDAEYVDRLRSLQTVDTFVGDLRDTLRRQGELDDTYIVFWSDNGYHLGNHRMMPGKRTPYLTDIQFPMVVSGPGVPRGKESDALISGVDLAPTFASIAGNPMTNRDGRVATELLEGDESGWRTEVLSEGAASAKSPAPAWKSLRTKEYVYVEYDNGEREFYDLVRDPFQLQNTYGDLTAGRKEDLSERLSALVDRR